jgi:hypothetical protein
LNVLAESGKWLWVAEVIYRLDPEADRSSAVAVRRAVRGLMRRGLLHGSSFKAWLRGQENLSAAVWLTGHPTPSDEDLGYFDHPKRLRIVPGSAWEEGIMDALKRADGGGLSYTSLAGALGKRIWMNGDPRLYTALRRAVLRLEERGKLFVVYRKNLRGRLVMDHVSLEPIVFD